MKMKRLKALRLELGYSLSDVATRTGLSVLILLGLEEGAVRVWDEGWTADATTIAAFHGVGPEEIWRDGNEDRRRAEGEAAGRWVQPVLQTCPVDRREERVRVVSAVPKLHRKTTSKETN